MSPPHSTSPSPKILPCPHFLPPFDVFLGRLLHYPLNYCMFSAPFLLVSSFYGRWPHLPHFSSWVDMVVLFHPASLRLRFLDHHVLQHFSVVYQPLASQGSAGGWGLELIQSSLPGGGTCRQASGNLQPHLSHLPIRLEGEGAHTILRQILACRLERAWARNSNLPCWAAGGLTTLELFHC